MSGTKNRARRSLSHVFFMQQEQRYTYTVLKTREDRPCDHVYFDYFPSNMFFSYSTVFWVIFSLKATLLF
jgi:hypothetical protein